MIKAQYTLLCDDARPSLNNTIDVLGIFDRVYAQSFPTVHRRLTLVCQLVAEGEDDLGRKPFRITVTDPNGVKMFEQTGSMHLKPEGGTFFSSGRLMVAFEGFPLAQPGRYVFSVRVDDQDVASHPLSVVLAQKPV